jgi:ABC-type glutathione transport system ATPase component
MVTHDLAQASRLAERALLLESGRIVRAGPVEEVLRA